MGFYVTPRDPKKLKMSSVEQTKEGTAVKIDLDLLKKHGNSRDQRDQSEARHFSLNQIVVSEQNCRTERLDS